MTITNFQNLNVFQGDAGEWHAVLAIGVRRGAQPDHWTVLLHAHPSVAAAPDTTPLAWSADSVLSGSSSNRVDGNYDGKYFEDGRQLYLLYVKNFVPRPALRNEIVIQPMLADPVGTGRTDCSAGARRPLWPPRIGMIRPHPSQAGRGALHH